MLRQNVPILIDSLLVATCNFQVKFAWASYQVPVFILLYKTRLYHLCFKETENNCPLFDCSSTESEKKATGLVYIFETEVELLCFIRKKWKRELGNLLRQIWIESCKLRRANCQSILDTRFDFKIIKPNSNPIRKYFNSSNCLRLPA